MPRPVNRLSARTVATLKAPGLHADGAGLYLRIDKRGAKQWVFLFQWKEVRKEMGLGSASLVTLAEARAARDLARRQVFGGMNPIEARKAARIEAEAVTFGDMADEVLATLERELENPKHRAQWNRSLKTLAADLGPKPVAAISTEDVLAVLRPIWDETPETANRTRGRIERVLDAAKAKNLRTGENPARWRGHMEHLLAKRRTLTRGHHAALPFAEAPAFVQDLRSRPALAARALELTILTAVRSGEALGARWSELDLAGAVWTIPAERMKARAEHRVPLSAPVVRLLRQLQADAETAGAALPWVFPNERGTGPLSGMSMAMLLRRMGREEITVHGFRSTFRDWAGDRTEFPREIAEAALAHAVGNKVEQSYRRGDALEKRRGLMDAWAAFIGAAATA